MKTKKYAFSRNEDTIGRVCDRFVWFHVDGVTEERYLLQRKFRGAVRGCKTQKDGYWMVRGSERKKRQREERKVAVVCEWEEGIRTRREE